MRITNAAGTLVARVYHGPPGAIAANTDYDILMSLDLAQTTAAAGFNCFVNGNASTISSATWTSGATAGWTRTGSAGTVFNFGGVTFRLGAFYLNTATRLDLTNAANRAKFTSATSGNLDILTRGNGITGAIPSQFLVGNADQWNDGSGMNRGSAAGRFFVTAGTATLISGAEWV
jgi:hypothetical protein